MDELSLDERDQCSEHNSYVGYLLGRLLLQPPDNRRPILGWRYRRLLTVSFICVFSIPCQMERETTTDGFPGLFFLSRNRLSLYLLTGHHHVPSIPPNPRLGRPRNRNAPQRSICSQFNMAQCAESFQRKVTAFLRKFIKKAQHVCTTTMTTTKRKKMS